ncbi:MAG: hypothetical protein EBS41_01435 [Actinobacteria bacterium]|nr:hypothetical protein [Actinomycetota bacterium]
MAGLVPATSLMPSLDVAGRLAPCPYARALGAKPAPSHDVGISTSVARLELAVFTPDCKPSADDVDAGVCIPTFILQ